MSVRVLSSFKDPFGQVEVGEQEIFRNCAPEYLPEVQAFLASTLYAELIKEEKIIPANWDAELQVFRQPRIQLWSYPYEWSVEMLRDAALLTLELQERALRAGFMLKDASAYNIVFTTGRPIHADLYSFVRFEASVSWPAYDQFCREFLNPLLLDCCLNLDFQKYFAGQLNGISTEDIARLLPLRQQFTPGLFTHVFCKRILDARYGSSKTAAPFTESVQESQKTLAARIQNNLVRKLRVLLEKLRPSKRASRWTSYETTRVYSDQETSAKRAFVRRFCTAEASARLIDYGCNLGEFSKLAAAHFVEVVALDSDALCIDRLYRVQKTGQYPNNVLALVQNLANPSPSMGWCGLERSAFGERIHAEAFLALALIHHLRFSCNLPTKLILDFFADTHRCGIIEHVELGDPMVRQLLRHRRDFNTRDYESESFLNLLRDRFEILEQLRCAKHRTLYYVRRHRS